jgi:hypothetical protein
MIPFILIPFPCFLDNQGLPFFRSILLPLARHHPLLYLSIPPGFKLLLVLLVDVEKGERISNQILLDVLVKRSIRCEAGSIVDLEKIGVQLMI